MIHLYESETEVRLTKRGNKQRGLFFLILGTIFQILFVWGYWSFLDATGPAATFWLAIINSEYLPFTTILFIFGAGCILIAIREFGWQEAWIIKTTLLPNNPGIEKKWKLFWYSKSKKIVQNQIITIRMHSIPLDKYKLYQQYQLELDYTDTDESKAKTVVLYKDEDITTASTAERLATKIHEILGISTEIERTQASNPIVE
jgi:hypothetical protein